MLDRFDGVQTQVLGLSVDSVPSLKAWAESLGGITFPLLSDFYPHGRVANLYGVLRPEGYSERAIFVVDKKGIVCYVDVHDIDDQPDNEVLFGVLEELEPQGTARPQPAQTARPLPQAQVVMYCTPWCPDCRKARAFMQSHGVDFVEVDISRDREAAQRVRSWTGGKEITPSFEVRGIVLIDYSEERLAKVLGIKR